MAMESASTVGAYMKALNEIIQVTKVLRTIDEYNEALVKFIKLPIRLPKIETYSRDRLKEKIGDIEKVFHNIAREMGHEKVVVARFQGDDIVLEEVDVEKINLGLYMHDLRGPTHYGDVIILTLATPTDKIGELPIAWNGANEEGIYYAKLYNVLLTALLISRNPWIVQALKRAIEAVFGDYEEKLNNVFAFYNALKMLGAEDAK